MCVCVCVKLVGVLCPVNQCSYIRGRERERESAHMFVCTHAHDIQGVGVVVVGGGGMRNDWEYVRCKHKPVPTGG